MIRGATYGRKNYQIATIKYESFGQVGWIQNNTFKKYVISTFRFFVANLTNNNFLNQTI